MVLVNGRENYTDGVGSLFWQFMPIRLDEIRQIEIIKGPSGAVYGFNAASGVINIITYNPQHEKINAERVTLGTDGTREVSAVQSAQWNKGGARVSAFSSQVPTGDFHPSLQENMITEATRSATRTANLDTQVQFGDSTHVRIQSGAAVGNMRATYLFPLFIKYRVLMNQVEATSETGIGDLRFFLSNNDYHHQVKAVGPEGLLDNKITIAKLQDVFKIGASDTFRIGAEYRHHVLPTYPDATGTMKSQNAALSGMWIHAFSENFTLLNAARMDRFKFNRSGAIIEGSPYNNEAYDRAFTATSYNSAAVYRFSQLDSVKMMASRGLQLPSLFELGGASFVALSNQFYTALFISSPNLNPATNTHYEVSYERQFPELAATGRIAAYHEDVKHLRDQSQYQILRFEPPTLITGFEEVGDVRLHGLEVEGSGKFLGDWRWGANYAYERINSANYHSTYKDYAKTTPRHKVNLSLGWSKGPWEIDAFLRYQSSANFFQQQNDSNIYKLFERGPVWATNLRTAYQLTPNLRTELVLSSRFADNPLYTEKARALLSFVGNF